ncbi:hypothetical protein LEMLEM_LOCUS27628, partial [Lemmus lemmus]
NEPIALANVTRKLASYWPVSKKPAQQLPEAFFKLRSRDHFCLLATGRPASSARCRWRTADIVELSSLSFPKPLNKVL